MSFCLPLSLLIVGSFTICATAEVTYLPLAEKESSIWDSDSLFLGAAVEVIDSLQPVVVTWKSNQSQALGELFLKDNSDTSNSTFLFHNQIEKFPLESTTVDIGNFPSGTRLVFMYLVSDTCNDFASVVNLPLFTGQNRVGTDTFISELEKPGFGRRWAIAGAVALDTCEFSFAGASASFREIRFHVSNVVLIKE